MSRFIAQLGRWWREEADRRFLWLPILFATGVCLYFALPTEPTPDLLWRLAGGAGGLMVCTRSRHLQRLAPLSFALLLIAVGVLFSSLHTARHIQPIIGQSMEPRPVFGTVEDIERTEHGVRFTLSHLDISRLPVAETPQSVRLSVRIKAGTEPVWPHIGERVYIMAGLMPPMGPALPHGFDFSRYFFFRGIGAVGYGLPPWKILPDDTAPTLKQRFLDWRFSLTDRIIDSLDKHNGPIAAGLITGEARAMNEDDFDALKASNLYHIIAISGGHMVVIAGVIFVGLRILLLAFPGGWAQRQRGKSTAACATLVLTTLYLAVTGMPISAVRAYVMIVLVLLAVMFGRRVDPMRSLALTFWIMLLYDPSDLFEPGFELSFAATLAIVALVEAAWFRSPIPLRDGWLSVAFRLFWLSLLITVAAEAATTPLVIAMFNNFSTYGLFSNLLATPLVTFFLMPTVALFFLLLPLGLEHFALVLMDSGISALLWIAQWTAHLPHARFFVPSLPGWGTALFTLGLMWFCLWRKRPHVLGIPLMALGMFSLLTVHLPDMLIGPGGKQIAVRTAAGMMQVKGRANAMVPELWANGMGQEGLLPKDKEHVSCEEGICRYDSIAFAANARRPLVQCVSANVIITDQPLRCNDARVIEAGPYAQAIWFKPFKIETSADWQGDRPWRATPQAEDDE